MQTDGDTEVRLWRVLQVHTPHREFGGEDVAVEADRRLLESAGHTVAQAFVENPQGAARATVALLQAPWNLGAARHVVETAHSFRPDVVHVHNTWFALSPAVVSALARSGYPVVVTLHNFRTVCANGLLQRDGEPCVLCVGTHPGHAVVHRCYRGSAVLSVPAALTISVARRRMVWSRYVSRFFALDESAVTELAEGGIPLDRITIRPNFVSHAPVRPSPPSSSPDVVFVGRLSAEKGVPVLLEAWRRADLPGCTLHIYGDGPLRRELEQLGVPRVRFHGRVSHDEVDRALQGSRALVFPSTCREAGPLAPLEALAAGVPLVMSDIVGMSAHVVTSGAGWAFPAGDVGALATRLRQLCDDAEVDAAGIAAAALHRERHSPATALTSLVHAYQQVYDRQVTRR